MRNKPCRNKYSAVIKRIIYILCALFAAVYVFFGLQTDINVIDYTVYSDKVTSAVRIIDLSDIHNSLSDDDVEEIYAVLERLCPNAVVYTGDTANFGSLSEKTAEMLTKIAGEYPSFLVTGNHEYENEAYKELLAVFESAGITVLDGESVGLVYGENGEKIEISGVGDIADTESEPLHIKLAEAVRKADENCADDKEECFRLLLSHRPELIWLYSRYGFDCVLCGHAHGGQWRLPPLINGVYAPDQGFFPKYTGGYIYRYEYKNTVTRMIVSRGLSEDGRMPRLFNRPEIVCVDILPSRNIFDIMQ